MSKGNIRQSNSFNSAVIVAAGESSKTDTREFIEQQRQLLDELKCPTADEDVAMNDDEITDSTSSNLNFDYKYFQNTPPNTQPIATQPGFSESAYSEYVSIGKDGNEEVWRSYNNMREQGMFAQCLEFLVLCCGVQL